MQKLMKIEGMSCDHCKKTVETALKGIEGVTEAVVDLDSNSAVITLSRDVADETFFSVISDIEYDPISIEAVPA